MPRVVPSGTGRIMRLLAAAGMSSAVAGVLDWAVGTPAHAVAGSVAALRTGYDAEVMVVAAAGAAAWAGLLWFALLLGLEAGATLPGVAGTVGARLAANLGPSSARVAARWLIGVSMTASPLVIAAPALAGTPGGNITPLAPASLDRPAAVSITGSTAVPRPTNLDRPPTVGPSTDAGSAPPATSRPGTATGYRVGPGDTLWGIAARHLGAHATSADVAASWPRWYAANRTVIGADPNLIRPGELLRAPPT